MIVQIPQVPKLKKNTSQGSIYRYNDYNHISGFFSPLFRVFLRRTLPGLDMPRILFKERGAFLLSLFTIMSLEDILVFLLIKHFSIILSISLLISFFNISFAKPRSFSSSRFSCLCLHIELRGRHPRPGESQLRQSLQMPTTRLRLCQVHELQISRQRQTVVHASNSI